MISSKKVTEQTKKMLDFIHSLPSAKNIRVYTQKEQNSLNIERETVPVRRSIIRRRNSK